MINWHTKEINIEDLKEWEKNPRSLTKVEYNRLLDSLDELGDFSGITVDADNTVISGNQRLRALRERGVEKILVRCPDRKLTDEEIDKIGLLANRHSGSWDMDMLANEFESELLASVGLLEELKLDDLETQEDDFETPREAKYEISQGDIIELGNHRLMCGDGTSVDDISKLLNEDAVDLILTDPPYGISYKSNWKNSVSSTEILGDDEYCSGWIPLVEVESGYVFCRYDSYPEVFSRLKDSGFRILNVIVWDKQSHTAGNLESWANTHEFIVYYGKRSTTIRRKQNIISIRRLDNGAVGNQAGDNMCHPTQKPVELIAEILSVEPHGTVTDLFGGSGSTLIACEQLNRRCYMMELDPFYCSVIIERWEKLTGLAHKRI